MKIIISPSKTLTPQSCEHLTSKTPLFLDKHNQILHHLQSLSKQDLKRVMKLSDSLTNTVYSYFHNREEYKAHHALSSFTGLVYKNLRLDTYSKEQFEYIEHHVRILDAMYGILEPGTTIKPYRLDFNMRTGMNLYDFWDISSVFKDDIIVNLASNEYSKMLHKNMINITFFEQDNGTIKTKATYAKQARGKLLHYMIQNQITSIQDLQRFRDMGYQYHEEFSTANNFVFVR